MEWFLGNVCTPDWNLEQDRGRDWDEAVALLVKDHPTHEPKIRAFHERWDETVSGVFEDHVVLLQRLREAGVPNYCITNFSSPKFALSQERYPVPLGLRRHRRLGRRASPEARSCHLPTAPRPLWPRSGGLRLHRRFEGQCGRGPQGGHARDPLRRADRPRRGAAGVRVSGLKPTHILNTTHVVTGLVPVIPIREAPSLSNRDGRDEPGHDVVGVIPGGRRPGRGSIA